MKNGIPKRKHQIKFADLSQDFRRKDEHEYDDLQRSRKFHLECDLHQARDYEQKQCQRTEEHIFIVSVKKLKDQHHDHKEPQRKINDERASVLPQFHIKRGA